MGGPSKPKTPPQPDPEEERRKARREAEAIAQEDAQARARYGRRSTVLGGARRRSTVLGPGGGVSAGTGGFRGKREEARGVPGFSLAARS